MKKKKLKRMLDDAVQEVAQAHADLARVQAELVTWRDTKTRYVSHLEEESGIRNEDRWGTTTRPDPTEDETAATIDVTFVGDGGEPCWASYRIPQGGGIFYPLSPHPIMERVHGFVVRTPSHPLPKEELIEWEPDE